MIESILPGLDLMVVGMSIVFSFLLLLIIATKLMSLIVGSIFDDTSLIKKVDTSGSKIISNQEKQIIIEVLGLHKS